MKSLDAEFVVDALRIFYHSKLYKSYSSASMESTFCKILLGILFKLFLDLLFYLQEFYCYIYHVPSLIWLAYSLKEFIKTFK